MPIEILMPALSPTMTEGNLAKWLVRVGDSVSAGDAIAEIETDKATMEVEAVDEGRIGRILIDAGAEAVKVNRPIALLLEDGEDETALTGYRSAAAPAVAKTPAPRQDAAAPAPAGTRPSAGGGRVFASPLARRIAKHAGLDIAGVTGSGPHGRIVKRDVEAALAAGSPVRAAPAAPPPATLTLGAAQQEAVTTPADAACLAAQAGGIGYSEIPNTGMRKAIARRLQQSKRETPHFYLTVDCRVDELLKLRRQLNGRSDAHKLSVNDFVIRAVAIALTREPEANAAWSEEAILQWDSIDISVAVAIDGGLIAPIVKHADRKGLAQISNEMKDLAARAKDGKLRPAEFQGGTFSVSNLGMYGIRAFCAIINPPQACILAVGAGEQRPVVTDGALSVATAMTCTLSCDHRAVDGAVGARFLSEFKNLIEDPLTMLL